MKGRAIALVWVALALCPALAGCLKEYNTYRSKSLQTYARVLAKQIVTCEEMYYIEHNEYTDDFEAMDCDWPSAYEGEGAPYTLYLGPDRFLDLSGTHYQLPPGIDPLVTGDRFMAAIAGNIDDDPLLDVWTVDNINSPENVMNDLEN